MFLRLRCCFCLAAWPLAVRALNPDSADSAVREQPAVQVRHSASAMKKLGVDTCKHEPKDLSLQE